MAQVTREIGVTDQTIRYYEKCGVVKPDRVGEAPHAMRIFSESDIAKIKKYRASR